jgi:hypothetical protein
MRAAATARRATLMVIPATPAATIRAATEARCTWPPGSSAGAAAASW